MQRLSSSFTLPTIYIAGLFDIGVLLVLSAIFLTSMLQLAMAYLVAAVGLAVVHMWVEILLSVHVFFSVWVVEATVPLLQVPLLRVPTALVQEAAALLLLSVYSYSQVASLFF